MPTLKLRRIAIVAPGEIGLCEQVFAQLDLPEGHSLSVAHATPPDSLRAVHRKIYGERLDWDAPLVVDKHCIGGIPGNRTTMVVVPIVAAHGMWMPKTSSRAITSPAGTADTMEVLAQVNVEPDKLRQILHQESASSAASTTCNWAHIARLAGAPLDKQAGVDLHKKLGDSVERGDALYTIHAEFLSDFNFAKTAAAKNSGFQLGATTQ